MKLLNKKEDRYEEAVIELVKSSEYPQIKKNKQFEFNWLKEKGNSVFKIRRREYEEILGLISLIDFPKELRIEIHLLEISKENIGKNKKIDLIAGCLIAFACELAFSNDYDGFVSLVSKTEIRKLYKEKYGFNEQGNHLFTSLRNSENLIKKYLL